MEDVEAILIGIITGIISSLIVTVAYRYIDNRNQTKQFIYNLNNNFAATYRIITDISTGTGTSTIGTLVRELEATLYNMPIEYLKIKSGNNSYDWVKEYYAVREEILNECKSYLNTEKVIVLLSKSSDMNKERIEENYKVLDSKLDAIKALAHKCVTLNKKNK